MPCRCAERLCGLRGRQSTTSKIERVDIGVSDRDGTGFRTSNSDKVSRGIEAHGPLGGDLNLEAKFKFEVSAPMCCPFIMYRLIIQLFTSIDMLRSTGSAGLGGAIVDMSTTKSSRNVAFHLNPLILDKVQSTPSP